MIRKFYVNMSQKGKLIKMTKGRGKENMFKFHKTNKKSVEILEFDDDEVKNYFTYNYDPCFLYVLGINKNNPYKDENEKREIKSNI